LLLIWTSLLVCIYLQKSVANSILLYVDCSLISDLGDYLLAHANSHFALIVLIMYAKTIATLCDANGGCLHLFCRPHHFELLIMAW
jgi:hypothetical protein